MASSWSMTGAFSRLCGGEDDSASSCNYAILVDAVNLVFICCFYLSWVVTSLRRCNIVRNQKKDPVHTFVSFSCALTSISYCGVAAWNLIDRADIPRDPLSICFYIFRGMIWMSTSISLHVIEVKEIRTLLTTWWVVFCSLATAVNVKALSGGLAVNIFDMITWPINFALLFCAYKSRDLLVPRWPADLHEPLLSARMKDSRSDLHNACFFSRLIFSWVNPLLRRGYSGLLELNDIPPVVSKDESVVAFQRFSQAWESLLRDECSNTKGNLVINAVAKTFFKENIVIGFFALLKTVSVVLSPLLLQRFVKYCSRQEENANEGLKIIGSLVLLKLVQSFSHRHWQFESRRSGMRIRSALMAATYQKQLKLSSPARQRHSTGEIVNFISVDAYRMVEFPRWFHYFWSLLLQLLSAVVILWTVVGVGALPGTIPLLVFGFLNFPLAKTLQKCQSCLMKAKDDRLRLTSEILNNMKIIKIQSWEAKFKEMIQSRRDTEIKWLTVDMFTKPYGTLLYWLSPTVVTSIVFLGCIVLGSVPLDAGTIFTILASLRNMAEPVKVIPDALTYMIQTKVSFDRINRFLLEDETGIDKTFRLAYPELSRSIHLEIVCGDFAWDPESARLTLAGITFDAKNGEKIAVCGPVGSGKSTLLCALLGEIPKTSGTVNVFGSVAYVSQTSWIQSGTIRDSILFGKPMEETRYEMAVRSCALDKDISGFEYGDLTEIGQRGINLSGGQKQRIQLARAVYNDADIYLLDDPFSAVDPETATILFNECIMGALQEKLVILVTHQVGILSEVDRILVMEDGKIVQSGSYEGLLSTGTTFEKLVDAHEDALAAVGTSGLTEECMPKVAFISREEAHTPNNLANDRNEVPNFEKGVPGRQLTAQEEMETGDIGWKPFCDYLLVSKASTLLISATLTHCVFIALQAASAYWLALAIQHPEITDGVLIGVYAAISSLSAAFVYLRSYLGAHMGIRASKAFFSRFTGALFKAPILFYDSTPVGRIFARASSDMSTLDSDIPFAIIFVMCGITELLGTIFIMASVTWRVLIIAMIVTGALKYIQSYYFVTARQLTRINGTTKAPVMDLAVETSLGLTSIRAFDKAEDFFRKFLKIIDEDSKLSFYSYAAMEWLNLRVEILQSLTFFAATMLIILLPRGSIPPGLVGLSFTYALTLSQSQIFLTQWYCQLSNFIISVERIRQYMQVAPEPAAIMDDHRPPESWPEKGRIELHELQIRYRPNTPLVLNGITCTICEGSKVGVVGRTGSGKTTLISALFRLVEPAGGRICIDGLDITTIGLKDLRMKLSVIPQEPTLFQGSVRTNMDPLGLYSDSEIWNALEKCQLKATISSLPNLLDSSVSNEGENWSVGQQQLFCLGRVLLQQNRILVLDEATASVDSATDALVQRIIRQEFAECTVITVAHRVPTVVDSDMVMVLSYGSLIEYEQPLKLMGTDSYFSKPIAEYWTSNKNS
ncbi:hypothetical protein MLD38_012926 [Melastoma candidum]|uniref:Uncharacterized protein n=1 Tax=Melastoma candidum TaxID=119954 RepID=A0ACB9R967_9MYRT|nr:hypothetical protein MLD38_012926 [Melastoma candidum]